MITSDDLVNDLGLSRTAISQIINGKGRYAEATRQRVLARVRELGYTPHAGARAARLKRFETIALFNAAAYRHGLMHPGLYEGCLEGCSAAGHRLLLETVTGEGLPGLAQRSNLFGQRVCDGLLMNYHLSPPEDLRRLVDACGIPVLWLNVRLAADCIYPDDRGAAERVGAALIQRGRRRVLYVDGGQHDYATADTLAGAHYSVADRWRGVGMTLGAAGAGFTTLAVGDLAYADQVQRMLAVLRAPERPDAIVCYNEVGAQLALHAIAEAGLRAGGDISVVQFSETAHVLKRPVATAVIPFRELGLAATGALIAAVADGEMHLPATAIPFTFEFEETL